MDELRITAIHEAGHAVIALRLGLVFDHVTAEPDYDDETDGALHWTELQSAGDLEITPEVDALVLLAGPFAEAKLLRSSLDEVFAGEVARDDREGLATLGLTGEQFVAASREALALVEREWAAIERVAVELMNGPLTFADVESIAG